MFGSLQWRCGFTVACCRVKGHWLQQSGEAQCAGISPSGGGQHYPYHSLASDQTTGREHSLTHQQKFGLKIYWAWPFPPEQEPVLPTASPSHKEASTSLLSSSIRGQTEWKPESQKTNQTDYLDHKMSQWNYEPHYAGPPKTDGSWWRVLTKCGPLEKEVANYLSILASRSP